MSTTVDSKVVEMRFDNSNFEQNAKTSMSTLEKLKQKLNFSGATKGLEQVNNAVKKVDFSSMENAAYKSGFHIQDIWLKTASVLEYQVAGKIVNAAKKIASALTIQPITTGLNEYETQINAVQTILANTESKGSTLTDVNKALEELNKYADMTIYNFTEMTRNIGTFTAAGVDLDTSVNAIKGIANLAAVSGSTSQQASTAMYQLSQALASGTVKLMDWNSVVNAGMGGQVFQDALKETARVHGIAIDDIIEKQGSFRETLSQGWLTSEILTETLQKFTLTTEGLTEAEIEANREMLRAKGYTEDQIKEIFKLGNTATNAATKVKTFTQMWDVMKETAQSGWSQTWKIILGDFEEAKSLFTPLTNFFTGILNRMSEWRNNLLSLALESPLGNFAQSIASVGEVTKKVTDALVDLDEIVNRVNRGEFGNGQTRFENLTEAGYNYYRVQNAVNEKLNDSFRHSEEVIASQDKLLGSTEKATEVTKEANDAREQSVEFLRDMTDAQLAELGITKEELDIYEKLLDISKRTGIPIEEINGRLLLLESFKFIGQAIVGVFRSMKIAWDNTFESIKPVQLLNIIDGFYKFASSLGMVTLKVDENGNTVRQLKIFGDTANKIRRSFEGLFAALDIVLTLTGGGLRIAFKVLGEVLSAFDLNILDLTAGIGDVIVNFRDWLDSMLDIEGAAKKAADTIRVWIDAIKNSKRIGAFTEEIRELATAFREWIAGLKETDNLSKYIAEGIGTLIGNIIKGVRDLISGGFSDIASFSIEGFLNGIRSGIGSVVTGVQEFAQTIISTVCEILGIESPSKVMFAIGGFVVAGFILGFRDKIGEVWPALGEFANSVVDFVKTFDFGKLFAAAGSIGMLAFAISISKVFGGLADLFGGLGDLISSFQNITKEISKGIKRISKSISNSLNAMAFKQFAIAIAILVGSIVVLTLLDIKEMWNAVGVIAALAAIMAALFLVVNKLGSNNPLKDKTTVIDFGKMAFGLLAIGGAIMLMALAAKSIAKMDDDAIMKAGIFLGFLAGMVVTLVASTRLFGGINGTNADANIAAIGKTLIQIALSIMILVVAAKLIASMSLTDIVKASAFLLVLTGIIALLMLSTRILSKTTTASGGRGGFEKIQSELINIGKVLIQISAAMLILTFAAKIIAGMEWSEIGKAAAGLSGLAAIMVGLIAAMKLVDKTTESRVGTNASKSVSNIKDLGKTLFAMAAGLLVMVAAAKIIAGMEWSEMAKAGVGLTYLAGIIAGLTMVTKLAGTDLKGVAGTILAMSIAIGIMAASMALLGLLDLSDIAKGGLAIGILATFLSGMIAATKNAAECASTIMAMAVAIGVMAASVAILSFIPLEDLASAALGLGIVISAFALALSQTKGINKESIASLAIMTGAIAIIAASIFLLGKIGDTETAIKSAVAIGAVLVAMSAALYAAGQIPDGTIKKALKGVVGLLAMMALLVALIAIINFMPPNVAGNLDAMYGVIGIMAALSAMLVVTAAVGTIYSKVSTKAMLGLAGLAAMIGALALLVLALNYMPANAGTNVEAMKGIADILGILSVLLVVTAAAGAIYAATGGIAMLGLVGLAAMIVLTNELAKIVSTMPVIPEESITAIHSVMKVLAEMSVLVALLGVVSPFIVLGTVALWGISTLMIPLGIFVAALRIMPDVGEGISRMMEVVALLGVMTQLFLPLAILGPQAKRGVKALSALVNVMEEVTIFAGIVGALAKSDVIKSCLNGGLEFLEELSSTIGTFLGNFISGVIGNITGLPEFGKQLSDFMTNVTGFVEGIKTVDGKVLEGVTTLVEVIGLLTGSSLGEKLLSGIFGESSFESFGEQLKAFGECIVDFSNQISGNVDAGAITAAAEVGAALADLSGKTVSLGTTNWAEFNNQIIPFGTALVRFSKIVAGNIDETAIDAAVNAGNLLTALAGSLPPTSELDGVEEFMSGCTMGFEEFGEELVRFGNAMVRFSSAVSANGAINYDAIENAKSAAELMTGLSDGFGNTSDFTSVWEFFKGKEMSFKEFGEQLMSFGIAIVRFSSVVGADGAINQNAVENAATAGRIMAALGDTLPDKGTVAGFFGIGEETNKISFEKFGKQIVKFAESVVDFSRVLTDGGIDLEAISTATNAGIAICNIHDALPKDMDMSEISTGLDTFGQAMVDFSTQISGHVDLESVAVVTEAGKTIATAVRTMPDTGTISQVTVGLAAFGQAMIDFANMINTAKALGVNFDGLSEVVGIGEQIATMTSKIPPGVDLTNFSTGLSLLGGALVSFYNKVTGTAFDVNAISNAVGALESLVLWTNDISMVVDPHYFIDNLKAIGQALVDFSGVVSADGAVNTEAITAAAKAGEGLNTFLNNMVSTVDPAYFIDNLKDIGQALVDFSAIVSADGAINSTAIETATTAGDKLNTFLNGMNNTADVAFFAQNISDLAAALVGFCTTLQGANAVGYDASAITAALKTLEEIDTCLEGLSGSANAATLASSLPEITTGIMNFCTELASLTAPDLTSIESAMSGVATACIDGFLGAFSSGELDAIQVGSDLIDGMNAGIRDRAPELAKTMTDATKVAAVAAKNCYSDFRNAGGYAAQGFANGILNGTWQITSAVRQMAQAAVIAARNALQINSPSKIFDAIGQGVPEGFSNGIVKLGDRVRGSVATMASNAIDGTKSAISRIADVINSDIDTQPTIRPVLDLSDVTAGANALGNMFGSNTLALSNAGAISSMMNGRRSVGNGEVLSALESLGKKLGDVRGDIYNVNGITYDDGSNVSDAVRVLVRAAKVERRR